MNGSEYNQKYHPLFETKKRKGRVLYRSFALSVFVGICVIWVYRLCFIPKSGENGRWVWFGLLGAEIWFGFYWILTQAVRWNQVYRVPFKDTLSQRYGDDLPNVDVFVCTADPVIEPPIMVVNTVLSAMAYDYPPEKLSVYLSDDGGSDLTFYALLEASNFAKHWIPYCKRFNVEPRSPSAYFGGRDQLLGQSQTNDFDAIKKLYEEMTNRIETAMQLGRIPEEESTQHKGFSQWEHSYNSKQDHDTILQSLIDGKDPNAIDADGHQLPTLVYLAREKRPKHHHHFKAGALNALIRVSSKISNGDIILTLDCDMYSNNSKSVLDALCFFMDDKQSNDIAFVQFPQSFDNVTKNELYSSSLRVLSDVEFHGADGYGGPLYVGTGCFHRRDVLCGKKYTKDSKNEWRRHDEFIRKEESLQELELETKPLASSTYEQNTQWGNEMGLKYGCPVEDVITGLTIQCRGWKSVYYAPERVAFLGVAPTSLEQILVQHKRWSEGDFQILLSKFSPAYFAHGKISFGLQLCYLCYCFWAPNCLATLYYSILPSLCILKGIALFPIVSSPWFIAFAYVIVAKYVGSLIEFLMAGGTVKGWWNGQRIWLYKRTTSYLFAFIDTILKQLGFLETTFIVTAKIADDDVSRRYEKEIMEFGSTSTSPMFTILATLALTNLMCLAFVVKMVVMNNVARGGGGGGGVLESMGLQVFLCGVLVLINLPLYSAFLFRKDNGRFPSSLKLKSFGLGLVACIFAFFC